jgi:Trk K+ transport system NAD-binding subunit
LVLVGGLVFYEFYHARAVGYAEACFEVFALIFMQPRLDFPKEWFLQPLFFLVPIVGLGAVADSVLRVGYLLFAQKRNLPEWQRMVASLYRNHIVVVGVGRVGYRTIKGLVALRESVVAIEQRTDSEFLDEVDSLGVPVIAGNGRHKKILEQAEVGRARAIILVTDDDLANMDAALTAREINPAIRVVLRLFDDTLATKFASRFDMPTISTSEVSAPAFIAAATGRKVYHSFQLEGSQLHLSDVVISPKGLLVDRTVKEIQTKYFVNIVMHRGADGVKINPAHDTVVRPEDSMLVIAPMERLVELEAANQPQTADSRSPVP